MFCLAWIAGQNGNNLWTICGWNFAKIWTSINDFIYSLIFNIGKYSELSNKSGVEIKVELEHYFHLFRWKQMWSGTFFHLCRWKNNKKNSTLIKEFRVIEVLRGQRNKLINIVFDSEFCAYRWQKVDIFDCLPPSSCKRSFWTVP